MSSIASDPVPDAHGHFGPYGGRYVPETLMHPLQELETRTSARSRTRSFSASSSIT